MNIFRSNLDKEKYIIAEYFLESKTNLREATWSLAIGQSVGNPNVRNKWETDELFENHSCMVLGDESELLSKKSGHVKIGFPVVNTDFVEDGISHLLCQLMGGQLDIDIILKCHLYSLEFPDSVKSFFKGPKYGITGIREYLNSYNKPILGGIIKPKIGITPKVLLEMVKEMVEGGIEFIKEDEIMSNPSICKIEERVPLIMNYLKDKKVIYAVCLNSDAPYLLNRVKRIYELGANALHVNFWSGIGNYKSIRDLDLPMFIHFQKSGDKILTNKNHDFHIDWTVICQLAGMMGVDFIHAGMWGGYMNDDADALEASLKVLRNLNVMPALSCGMHPGLVNAINNKFGKDYMANVGGAIHGHPGGTLSGVKAMRQVIDGTYGKEYEIAINKWGVVS